MVWENKVKVPKQFWQFGMELNKDNDYEVIVSDDGGIELEFPVKDNVEISYKIYNAANQPIEEQFI